ncbi:MAG: protein-glutamate O-methyltransferase CheR [Lachnospiraceae bacterium]|nr:protein-glutamate O-methyltransferase CheR [Lachnospiraceae bacterium]
MITEKEFVRIVNYVKKNFGIELIQKKTLITGRLDNYLSRNGYDSYTQLMDCVERNPNGDEARDLIDNLTTNHTYFMREVEHFHFLKEVVLPEVKKSLSTTKDLRTWCAAASTGEEPYTLAMIMKDFFSLEDGKWDTTVLATDISTKVLEFASKGKYLKEQIEPLPDTWKRRFFKSLNSEECVVTEDLKKEVIFRKFNLMDPLPFKQKLHIVFIRNVMIYFDEETKIDLVNRIYDMLVPGGYMFIGTTEAIDKSRTKFQFVRPSVYRK